MAHSREELIKKINLDEPDYPAIVAELKDDDIPTLVSLSEDENPAIATKALSCLGMMKTELALPPLEAAIKHGDAVIRVAAAHALQHMSHLAGAVRLVHQLLDDHDVGVKKFALKTVAAAKIGALKEKVQEIHAREIHPALKSLMEHVLDRLK